MLTLEERQLKQRIRFLANCPKTKHKIIKQDFDGIVHVKARGRVIPFGYKISEQHVGWWEPIPLEMEALVRAKEYAKARCKYEEIAAWVRQVTGRPITAMGVHKAIRRGY